ncbi:hypothetical protein B0H11DRAFT_2186009 [Mycena galericulata]|nr:hypothetical protein B0H11DRAFT_2186009 [Mycena galericulata]
MFSDSLLLPAALNSGAQVPQHRRKSLKADTNFQCNSLSSLSFAVADMTIVAWLPQASSSFALQASSIKFHPPLHLVLPQIEVSSSGAANSFQLDQASRSEFGIELRRVGGPIILTTSIWNEVRRKWASVACCSMKESEKSWIQPLLYCQYPKDSFTQPFDGWNSTVMA